MSVSEWSGRPDEREQPETAAGVAAPGRTPVPADTEERDGREALSDDLRRQLAAIIAHPKMLPNERSYFADGGCDRCPKALDAADAVIKAGFRLVSEDEATVELLAVAMHAAGCGCGMTLDEHQASMRHDFDEEDPAYADMARAAVRALREAGE